ncbi:Spermidine synthase [Caloramator mitchellensis]|uniref:Polyamine aminopropyltransferase n=1 Tax=Caloramator mitchellensis TaxID=908809 RepID=A0A0R3JV81_CALMK|nr:polyamine aminopropyltransferase [Caloramator mitchellensis]KRQ87472.1 Spermidine synthase [Caloramator mitchellensis]
MEMWLKEMQIDGAAMTYKVKETLVRKKTQYQDLAIVDTDVFGRMLVLDGIVQTTIKDEFVYHEMISHIPLFTHPNPKKVLVVGGGDGGAIREILKHPSVEKAVLCEIDGDVIDECKKYLPEISCALDDPRCEIFVGDGIQYVKEHKNEFDVIIVDSTDPFSIAEGLFGGNFYKDIYNALTEDGIFIAQTETPFYLPDTVKKVHNDAKAIFPITKLFMAAIPTYPGGYWSFTIGSKKYDPTEVDTTKIPEIDTKYYTREIHKACFVLPRYIQELVK